MIIISQAFQIPNDDYLKWSHYRVQGKREAPMWPASSDQSLHIASVTVCDASAAQHLSLRFTLHDSQKANIQ